MNIYIQVKSNYPLERPDSLSVIILAPTTLPTTPNSSANQSSVILKERLPTNIVAGSFETSLDSS